MLRLWLCKDRKKNTGRLLEEISALAAQGVGGQLLIVPEQFSHMTERQLCACGGDRISRFAEVLGFSRLATRVFSEVGGIAQTETDPVGRLLAMSLAVEQVRSRLKIYASCVDKPEFLLQMLDAFDELRAFCVTSNRLREVQRELTGVLAVKMEEIALLMDSLDAVFANLGQNPQTRLMRLLDALEESGFARNKHFYFDGFTDFNGVEREIIAQLLCDGAQVTVCLHCDSADRGGQQFESARRTAKALLRMAKEQSVEVRLETLPGEETQTPLTKLRQMLFFGSYREQPQEQEAISLILGGDRVAECRAAVGEMLRLTQEGLRWRDISVACADLSGYRPILESLLHRADIPAYYAGDADILNHPVVRMLLSALEAATDRMDRDTVMSYVKSGFLPITRDQCDRLENYVIIWNIEDSRWEKDWTMHPLGVDKAADERSDRLLAQINADRRMVILPLIRLRKELSTARNTAEMVEALDRFTESIALRKTLSAFSEHYSAAGELQKAQEYAQIYDALCKLMEQMYGVLGDSVRKPEEFYRLFRTALSQCSIGTIPARLDCVTVGSLMSQRRCDTKVVFLLGANEGSFPCAQENNSLLTDRERGNLQRVGIELVQTAASQLDLELSAIDSVLNAPSERLYLGAVSGQESYFYTRAAKIFPDAAKLTDDTPLTVRSKREYLAYLAGREGTATAPELADTANALKQAANYTPQPLTTETVKSLYGEKLRLSSTKIDELASCRFRFFIQYGLRASERRIAEVDNRMYGVFVHEVLEKTVAQVQKEGGFAAVALERVLELADAFMLQFEKEHADILESPRAMYLFRRNYGEVRIIVEDLYRELSVSEFVPEWLELGFSSYDGTLPPVEIRGEHMTAELEGKVDRVDVWKQGEQTYARVIDYKTGKKGFEYTNIYHGLSLQMLLYLFALRQKGHLLTESGLIPAGVLYFPARVDSLNETDHTNSEKIEKDRKKQQKRSGLLLDSYPVLQAMERCDAEPTYLPYGYDKENTRVGDLATEAQLKKLEDYVFAQVAAMGDALYSGSIEPNPYFFDLEKNNACKWCAYQTVCRERYEERWLEKVKNGDDFWQRLEASDG